MNSILRWLSVGAFVASCSTELSRTNRFDPDGTGAREPGRISGTVAVQGRTDQSGFVVSIFDGEDARVDNGLATDTVGSFVSAEVTPGTYRVSVAVPAGYIPIEVFNIDVVPGRTTDLGVMTSLSAPPVGVISGEVTVEDPAAGADDVRVVATLQGTGGGNAFVTFTDASGNYVFSELPGGDYEVQADRSGFTPDRTEVSVDTTSDPFATSNPLTLYPASAVIRFAVDGTPATYTSDRDVTLLLLAFGGVNEMRIGDSEDLTDGTDPIPWQPYMAEVPTTVSDTEGTKQRFVQFRVVDADQNELLRTEVYETSIVYDATAPEVDAIVLAPDAQIIGGVRHYSGDPSSVPLRLNLDDPQSGVAGVRVAIEGEDPTMVPYASVESPLGLVTYRTTLSLTPGVGSRMVQIQAIDRAGNETTLQTETLILDNAAPSFTVVANNDDTFTTDSLVALSFTSADPNDIVAFEVSNASDFSTFQTFTRSGATFSDIPWVVANPAADGLKTIYVRARDGAGNLGTASDDITLDSVAPAAPSIVAPTTGSVLATATPTYQWSGVGDASSYRVTVTGGSCAPCTSDVPTTSSSVEMVTETTALNDGQTYAVSVQSMDAAGNLSATSASPTFGIDLTDPGAPTIPGTSPIGNVVSNSIYTRDTAAVLAWDAPGGGDVDHYDIEVYQQGGSDPLLSNFIDSGFGGTLVVALTSTTSSVTTPTLSDSTYLWRVRSVDAAGRTSAWVALSYTAGSQFAQSFVVDTVIPASPRFQDPGLSVVNATASGTAGSDNDFPLTLSIRSDLGDASFWRYEIRGGHENSSFTALSDFADATSYFATPGDYSTNVVFHLVTDQAQNLEIRAVDRAGNTSDVDFISVREDSTAPSAPTNLVIEERSGSVTLRWDASASSDVLGYRVYYGVLSSSDPAAYTGQFAAEGSSPISVGPVTSFTLTGLNNFNSFVVAVTAIDQTEPNPNESGLEPSTGTTVTPRDVAITTEGSIAASGSRSVHLDKGYAYVAGTSNFYVYNVSNPDSPVLIDTFATGNMPDMEIYDGYAYLWNRDVPGLMVLNLHDPTNVTQVNSGVDGGLYWGPSAENYYVEAMDFAYDYYRYADGYAAVRTDGDTVCTWYTAGVDNAYRLVKFRVDRASGSTGGRPQFDTLPSTDAFTCLHRQTSSNYEIVSLEVAANRVFIANNIDGIYAYKRGVGSDLWTNPNASSPSGTCRSDTPSSQTGVDWYIVDYCSDECPDCPRGFRLSDAGLGTGTYSDLVSSGKYLYVAGYTDGIGIVDTTLAPLAGGGSFTYDENPAIRVGSRDDGGYYNRLKLSGNYLYAGNRFNSNRAIYVYDISDRSSPDLKGSWDTASNSTTYDFDMEGHMMVRVTGNLLEIANASRGISFSPHYSITPASSVTIAGSVFGEHANYVSSFFGEFESYDVHSTSAPSLYGVTNFDGQRACLDCGGSISRYTFRGAKRFDRFMLFWGEYEENGPANPPRFDRDPYLHVLSLGEIDDGVGSVFSESDIYLRQMPVGSTAANTAAINLINDVTVQGRWAYSTGEGITDGMDEYRGSMLHKMFVGGIEQSYFNYYTYSGTEEGHRIDVWRNHAAVVSADNQTEVHFFTVCNHRLCSPAKMTFSGNDYYTATSTRGSARVYGDRLYLGANSSGGETVEVLDLNPLLTGSLPTKIGDIDLVSRACDDLEVTGHLVYCTDDSADDIYVYNISDLANPYVQWSFSASNPGAIELYGRGIRIPASDFIVSDVQ